MGVRRRTKAAPCSTLHGNTLLRDCAHGPINATSNRGGGRPDAEQVMPSSTCQFEPEAPRVRPLGRLRARLHDKCDCPLLRGQEVNRCGNESEPNLSSPWAEIQTFKLQRSPLTFSWREGWAHRCHSRCFVAVFTNQAIACTDIWMTRNLKRAHCAKLLVSYVATFSHFLRHFLPLSFGTWSGPGVTRKWTIPFRLSLH